MKRSALLFTLGIGLVLAFPRPPVRALSDLRAVSTPRPAAWPAGGAYREGELIVAFRSGIDERSASGALRLVGAREARRSAFGRHFRVTLDSDVSVTDAVSRLSSMPEVDYAEPNGLVREAPGLDASRPTTLLRRPVEHPPDRSPPDLGHPEGEPAVAVAVLDTGIAYENFGPYRKAPDWGNVPFFRASTR